MNPLPAWFRARDWRTGGYHALGALAWQAASAALLAWVDGTSIFMPAHWWWGALIGGWFFTAREVWQCRAKGVWWQNRTPFDVLTAVVPVLIVAIAMECL